MSLGAWKSSKNQGSSLYNPSCVTCPTTGGAEGAIGGGVEGLPEGVAEHAFRPFMGPLWGARVARE